MTGLPPSMLRGANGVIDLGVLKARQLEVDRAAAQAADPVGLEQKARLCLMRAGLLCPCGTRVEGESVTYFTLVQERGEPVLSVTVLCSRSCRLVGAAEGHAIARREGPAGRVTWLDRRGDVLRGERGAQDGSGGVA
jgi:hypothetical protein